jgi:ribosome-binding protein aMBF1 (putative translation factor)
MVDYTHSSMCNQSLIYDTLYLAGYVSRKDLMDIGNHVRSKRRDLGLSQEALARRADVSLNLVNKIERGVVTDPHYSTLVVLADALGMTVSELIGEPTRPLVGAR